MRLSITDTIGAHYPALTRKQRLLADYMLAHPEEMSYMTLKELARVTNISEMTVLHACAAMGFHSYNELKSAFRQPTEEKQTTAIGLAADARAEARCLLRSIKEEQQEQLARLYGDAQEARLFQAAGLLLDAGVILICAKDGDLPAGQFLAGRLSLLGLPTLTVNLSLPGGVQGALPLVDRKALVLALSLPEDEPALVRLCACAAQRQAPVLCLTDDAQRCPATAYARMIFTVPASARLFPGTLTPMVALCDLLSAAVSLEAGARRCGGCRAEDSGPPSQGERSQNGL